VHALALEPDEKAPAEQATHTLAGMPVPVWKVPAMQDRHTEAAGPPSTVE
jgi:hypothetical protein